MRNFSGDKYFGEWENDIRQGKGIEFKNDEDKYEGDWKGDKYGGKGIYCYFYGEKYEGDLKDGKANGILLMGIGKMIKKWRRNLLFL